MSDYVLSCCSTVDMDLSWVAQRDLACVFFNYELDGVNYKDDFGATFSPAELYQRMLAGADAKTSQVSVGEYMKHFEPILQQGHDIVHVALSSGISGTYHSAVTAAAELEKSYPDRHIWVVDSLCASAGYGLFVDKLCDLRDEGMGAQALVEWAEQHRQELNHWFFSSDLTFFVRGGRISRTAGFAGGLLKICPVMRVAPDGSLEVVEKIRTKAKAIRRDLAIMEERAEGGLSYEGPVFISQSECLDDAQKLADEIEQAFPNLQAKPRISNIGATIGCHTGPGTVALFFWGKPRAE